ncbi:hypothetical protein LINGRAHAP2_LOCUS30304, partial [Linum grandiflorum]
HNKVNYPQKDRERAFHAAWGSDNESNTSDGDEEMFMAIADLSDDEVQATASSEVCFQTQLDQAEWALDSGCSHHMTVNAQPPQYISKRHPATQSNMTG